MLRWRLLLGFLMIAALVGLCWLDHLASTPGIYLLPLGLVLVVLASSELFAMLEAGGMKPRKGIVYVGNILLFASCWLPTLAARSSLPFEGITLCLFAACVLAAFFGEMLRYEKPGGNLTNLAASVFVLAYIGLTFYFLAQLRMTWGVGALASMIVLVKLGDTGAYTVGRLCGRHKMAPRLSPGKTIEGALGALLFSCAGAWLCFHVLDLTMDSPYWKSTPRIPVGWWIYGLCMGVAGMFGDLAESLIKRDVGRKDSSTWMPGFGGILDLLDSLLFAAPVAWVCWNWGIV
ncbi:MAG: phosphatidate cytidylyltransferase [Pirellulales bacterium]|nr:phosphatidate cytidylyltransferase [Pirellulales bacterium]